MAAFSSPRVCLLESCAVVVMLLNFLNTFFQARCDATSFESVRCTFCVEEGNVKPFSYSFRPNCLIAYC